MDLKIASGSANTEERQAVDSLLGAPQETSHGAQRDEMGMRVSTGGESLRKLRHLLLPTLHSVNDRVGYISRGAINYISQRLDIAPAEIYGVATFGQEKSTGNPNDLQTKKAWDQFKGGFFVGACGSAGFAFICLSSIPSFTA